MLQDLSPSVGESWIVFWPHQGRGRERQGRHGRGGGCGVGGVLTGDFAGHVEALEGPDAELVPDGDGFGEPVVGDLE